MRFRARFFESVAMEEHVNSSVLDEILSILGVSQFDDLCAEVMRDISGYQNEVSTCAGSRSEQHAQKVMHRMKGFSSQFGLKHLNQLAESAQATDGNNLFEILDEVKKELEHLNNQLPVLTARLKASYTAN